MNSDRRNMGTNDRMKPFQSSIKRFRKAALIVAVVVYGPQLTYKETKAYQITLSLTSLRPLLFSRTPETGISPISQSLLSPLFFLDATYPENTKSESGCSLKILKPTLMCLMNIGTSPRWNGSTAHSASSCPLVGPPSQMLWQHTIIRRVGVGLGE